jgi:hypothetical protein
MIQQLASEDVQEFIAKASLSQVRETPSPHLVQVYNTVSGRPPITKFSTRDVAIDRTFDAIQTYREEHPELEEEEVVTQDFQTLPASAQETAPVTAAEEDEAPPRQFRIKLPYTGKTRDTKKNSKRGKLLERMLDGRGILIEELAGEPWNWQHKDAYEGIRHIHVSLGYGLDQYPDGRIYAHTDEPGQHFPHEQKAV